jgi:acyl-coenzyme A synthetase/AMP-(fatty) acid ligase
MDDLPRSQIGKIMRRRVRDRIEAMETFEAG